MFTAAFASRSCVVWHSWQVQTRSASVSARCRCPHAEHFFEVGANRSTVTRVRPYHFALYSSWRRSSPNEASRMLRFSPAFCRTLAPGFAVVPAALAVIPLTFRSSIATAWFSRTIWIVVLWFQSDRQLALCAVSRASRSLVRSRRFDPRCWRARRWRRGFSRAAKRASKRGFATVSTPASVATVRRCFTPRSMPHAACLAGGNYPTLE